MGSARPSGGGAGSRRLRRSSSSRIWPKALLLRKALGPQPAIHVLNGMPPGAEGEAVAADLFAVINSAGQIGGLGRGRPPGRQQTAGCDPGRQRHVAAWHAAGGGRSACGAIRTPSTASTSRLVMSHLACADEPDHPANEQQRLAFRARCAKCCRRRLRRSPIRPASFSGRAIIRPCPPGRGALRHQSNAGRTEPDAAGGAACRQRSSRRAACGRGAGVGYGHTFRTTGAAANWQRFRSAMPMAGIAAPRPPPGSMMCGCPSSDACRWIRIILDISALPPGRLEEGDLVELLGPSQSVDDAAGHAGTIGYEILTSLGSRFHRRYVDG